MNFLISYLIVSFFAQVSTGEVFPSLPNRGSTSIGQPGGPPLLPANSQQNPLGSAGLGNFPSVGLNALNDLNVPTIPDTKVGWGTDKDNFFCLIIQISPEAIAKFAQGQNGQELPVNIPPEFRDRFQRVVIRVGTGEVERIPPSPGNFSSSRSNAPAVIAHLDNRSGFENRTPVSIDRSTDLLPTSGNGSFATQQPGISNPTLNASQAPFNGQGPNSGTNPFDRNNNTMNAPQSLTDPNSRFVNTPQLGTNGRTASEDLLPPNSLARQDNFLPKSPTRPSTLDFLKNNPAANYPNTNTGGFATANTPNLNPRGTTVPPYLASNPNQPQPSGFNDPAYTASHNNYSVPQYQQQSTFPQNNTPPPYNVPNVNPNTYATSGMANQLATPPLYRTAGSTGYPTNIQTLPPTNDPNGQELNVAPRNNLIQFLLLFSIIGNVYLGCWMGYLRQRYRELLCNMRGIPVSDLDS